MLGTYLLVPRAHFPRLSRNAPSVSEAVKKHAVVDRPIGVGGHFGHDRVELVSGHRQTEGIENAAQLSLCDGQALVDVIVLTGLKVTKVYTY